MKTNPVRLTTERQDGGFAIVQASSEEEDPYATLEVVYGPRVEIAEEAARHAGTHVGSDVGASISRSKAKTVGYVRWIETVERQKGIGRSMLEAVMDELHRRGAREVFLVAEPDRKKISLDALFHFYESLGFEHSREDPHIMRAKLPRKPRRYEENPGDGRSLEDAGKLPSTLVKGKPFEVTLGDGTVVFVSKDSQSREWRATKFVGGKPRGHFVVGLWEDAVAEVESRWWTEDLSGAKSSGWSHNPPDDDFTYTLPSEHLSAAANPAAAEKGFHDAFGIPYEAHLAPVWPKERRKYERKVRSPKQLAEYLAAAGDIPQEQFMVALLDASGALIGIAIISKGTLNEAAVHPREVFAAALAARAAGIIGIHNHPSGEVTPSDADVNLSKVLGDVGAIVGIPFLDHVVLGRNGEHTSMAQVGMLPKATRRHQNNPELNPPKSPEERAVDQEMERLDREKRRLFYEERDKVPVPASGWYDEEYTKGVHKKIRPLTDPIDAQLRELRAQKKAIRAAEAAAKASRPKKVPGGARGPEIRQGRCKKCDVRYKWVERPDVKTGTSGPNQWWRGIACPKCGGTLWRTATAPGSYLDSYVDLDAPGAGRPSSNPGVDGFDFADDFGQPAEPAEPAEPGRFHLDTLKRGDVVRVGKTRWHVFNAKHGAWVVKYGTSGKKMYQIYSGGGDRFVVQQMTGGGDLIGDPVAEGDAEVVGWEERA